MPLKISFFSRRKENLVFKMIEDFIQVVDDTVTSLGELLESIESGGLLGLEETYKRVNVLETKADMIRREISELLVRGVLFAHLKEDFLNLVEKIDNMADWAKDATRILVETKPQFDLLHTMFTLREMRDYINLCANSSSSLLEAIRTLKTSNIQRVIDIVHRIEDLEEKGDELKSSLIKFLIKESERYRVIDVIQMKEFILMLDNILDSAEDASDIILLMIAKGYE